MLLKLFTRIRYRPLASSAIVTPKLTLRLSKNGVVTFRVPRSSIVMTKVSFHPIVSKNGATSVAYRSRSVLVKPIGRTALWKDTLGHSKVFWQSCFRMTCMLERIQKLFWIRLASQRITMATTEDTVPVSGFMVRRTTHLWKPQRLRHHAAATPACVRGGGSG